MDAGAEQLLPIEGSDVDELLTIFTVGADAAGLNLQSYGDALVLRPVQMDQLLQMMGRLDRPGQKSAKLCRAIIYLRRTHEEAEVAHLEKHGVFWNLHIKPLARLIVLATVGSEEPSSQAIGERYNQILATSCPDQPVASTSEVGHWMDGSIPPIMPRNFRVRATAAETCSTPRKFARLREQRDKGNCTVCKLDLDISEGNSFVMDLESHPATAVIDLDVVEVPGHKPGPVELVVPVRMNRDSVRMGVGYLIQHDPRFRHIVRLIGPPTDILELLDKGQPDPFSTLAQTICHQQLSLLVCQGMFERLLGLCGDLESKVLDPKRIKEVPADRIREVAKLSYRKIGYIQQLADQFLNGKLNNDLFENAPDNELRERMTQLHGIGEWTLEMFFIFQLHRHGGIPYGDVALQSAMQLVYDIQPEEGINSKNEVTWMPTRRQMEQHTRSWGPFGSIASLYLLRVADNKRAAVFLPD